MFTNAQILAAVINKWAQPLINTLMAGRFNSLGFVQNIEAKVKSTGWVSPGWSLLKDLSPIMEGVTGSIVGPMLTGYLSNIDDASIPQMAHGIVDQALKARRLEIMEGKVVIEESDLQELKRLLDFNLPLKEEDVYQVKEN